MKKSYFEPKPVKSKPKPFALRRRTDSGGTIRYRSFKEIPLWLKLVAGGVFALAAFLLLVPLVNMENREIEPQLRAQIERIHGQIKEGKFRDVFLEGDRELIASKYEADFAERLAKRRKYFAGNYQQTGRYTGRYLTLVDKLKGTIGSACLVSNYNTFRSDAGEGSEVFYWKVRGNEIKLVDYEFYARN